MPGKTKLTPKQISKISSPAKIDWAKRRADAQAALSKIGSKEQPVQKQPQPQVDDTSSKFSSLNKLDDAGQVPLPWEGDLDADAYQNKDDDVLSATDDTEWLKQLGIIASDTDKKDDKKDVVDLRHSWSWEDDENVYDPDTGEVKDDTKDDKIDTDTTDIDGASSIDDDDSWYDRGFYSKKYRDNPETKKRRDDFYAKWYKKPEPFRQPSGEKGKGTLVIHLKDRTTDMLNIVYEGRDFDVVDDGTIDPIKLFDMIEQHERIIMLGHGTGWGLLNPQKGGYVIDDRYADLLKTKETMSVWCHSDDFFRTHGMHGFHTGMIISEVSEARYVLGETPLTAQETYDNMILFSECIRDCLDLPPEEMKEYVLAHYVGDDKVTQYNRGNIIVL